MTTGHLGCVCFLLLRNPFSDPRALGERYVRCSLAANSSLNLDFEFVSFNILQAMLTPLCRRRSDLVDDKYNGFLPVCVAEPATFETRAHNHHTQHSRNKLWRRPQIIYEGLQIHPSCTTVGCSTTHLEQGSSCFSTLYVQEFNYKSLIFVKNCWNLRIHNIF
jgi:hypothetical protein